MTFDLPKFKMLYNLAAQPMFRLVDAALLAKAMCAGKATWEPVGIATFDSESQSGEIIVGGMRYMTHLECGYPILTFTIREALEVAMGEKQ